MKKPNLLPVRALLSAFCFLTATSFAGSSAPVNRGDSPIGAEITVTDDSSTNDVVNGATVQAGNAEIGNPLTRSFTVRNDGDTTLTLTDVTVTGDFTATAPVTNVNIAAGDNIGFSVEATSATFPNHPYGTVTIDNNDSNENPFVYYVEGTFCNSAITVTSNGDSGAGTLREAVANVCAYGTINFDQSLEGTAITLTSGSIYIDHPMNIVGPGADTLTLNAGFNDRALLVTTSSFDISGLTFTNGDTGGNQQAKSASRLPIGFYGGGAIAYINGFQFESGSSRTPISDESVITACRFTENSSNNGGAIYNTSNLRIVDSTFDTNRVGGDGGAIAQETGDPNTTPTLVLINSTFYANEADNNGSAIAILNGDLTMNFCTLTANISDSNAGGSGDAALSIYEGARTVLVSNSIIAQNIDATPSTPPSRGLFGVPIPDVYETFGTISGGYNLIGDQTGSSSFVATGDMEGTSATPLDALLGDNLYNGGPTPTCAIPSESPAYNAANPSDFVPADQRGILRPQGGAPDMGAFELAIPDISVSLDGNNVANPAVLIFDQAEPGDVVSKTFTISNDSQTTLTISNISLVGDFATSSTFPTVLLPGNSFDYTVDVTRASGGTSFATLTINSDDPDEEPFEIFMRQQFCFAQITVLNTNDSGPGSLRQAVLDVCPGGTINFDEDLAGQTITLTSGQIDIFTDGVTINGLGADSLTVSGNHESRIFYIATLTTYINDLHLADGMTTQTVDRLPAFGEPGNGGAIFVRGPLRGRGNVERGGSVTFPTDGLFLTRCLLTGSEAQFEGGAIYNVNVVTIDSTTIASNTANANGGGIANYESLFVVNTTIAQNNAKGDGGGVYNAIGYFYSAYNTISENVCDSDGNGNGDGGGVSTRINNVTKQFVFILTSLANTVIAENVDGSILVMSNRGGSSNANDVYTESPSYTHSNSGNVIGDNSTAEDSFIPGSDQFGTLSEPLDPGLGPLGDNGGPTPTYLPNSDSVTIDSADEDTTLGLDQRGVIRPIFKGYDVGAVERRSEVASITITGGDNQHTNINTAFPSPLAVLVKDGEGDPVESARIIFTVPGSGASATFPGDDNDELTDVNGAASINVLANGTFGSYQVTAAPDDTDPAPSVSFNLRNTTLPTALCHSVVVEAQTECAASVSAAQVDNGSNDADGGTVTLDVQRVTPDPNYANGVYGLGDTQVILTVTDDEGDTATCEATITVQDTTAPEITCPANIVVDATGPDCNADVSVGIPEVSDACEVTLTNDYNSSEDASAVYPNGLTTVTYTARDSSGNETTCSFTVTVNCTVSCMFESSSITERPGNLATLMLMVHTNDGSPVVGTTVDFSVISGPNDGVQQSVATDANGHAEITLSSIVEGTDIIVASGGFSNESFLCNGSINWKAPNFKEFPFDEGPEGWVYISPEPFNHPTSFTNESLGITVNDNTNSFGFWLSPVIHTGRMMHMHDMRGQIAPIPEITAADIYRVMFEFKSDQSDVSLVPTIRARSNTESLQQSDVLVITALDEGSYSPGTTPRHYPFYINMPENETNFLLSFDLLNFDPRDSSTASVELEHVMIDAIQQSSLTGSKEELFQDFTGSITNGWTLRDAAGFLAVPYGAPNELGLEISGFPPVIDRGNAFAIKFGYWGSPEGADLLLMDHTRLYSASFTFESSADLADKSLVPTFRGRVNSGDMKYAIYILSESATSSSITPTLGNAIRYTTYFQTPPELDGEELLFSFDWLFVPNAGNADDISVYLKELDVSSFDIPDMMPIN